MGLTVFISTFPSARRERVPASKQVCSGPYEVCLDDRSMLTDPMHHSTDGQEPMDEVSAGPALQPNNGVNHVHVEASRRHWAGAAHTILQADVRGFPGTFEKGCVDERNGYI